MGNASYSSAKVIASDGSVSYARSDSHKTAFFASAPMDETFTQQKLRRIHESMDPKGAKLREARDSATHPNTVPIILALDVTGSMGRIPHELIKTGLPHIMGSIIENGTPDPALLFLDIGDHQVDRHPLQVGQFESGDAELDTWLTRSYIEGGGGGNEGESYLLAYYFAGFHTVTDAWEKRKKKGFLFTVGDEPSLKMLPKVAITEIMGEEAGVETGFTVEQLLTKAQERYDVYHLHIMEGSAGHRSLAYWRELLGDHCIEVDNYQDVAKKVADIVIAGTKGVMKASPVVSKTEDML